MARLRVSVHRNITRGKWSVVDCSTGRVIAHLDRLMVERAQLVVRPAGRDRARREGRKNVHAFVRGALVEGEYLWKPWDAGIRPYERIAYNPFQNDTFVCPDDEDFPVSSASWVVLDSDGKAYASGAS